MIRFNRKNSKKFSKHKNEEYKINNGIIASGDIFCTEVSMKDKIYAKFKADCVEMEGAAIAQVCYLDKIPFSNKKYIRFTKWKKMQ